MQVRLCFYRRCSGRGIVVLLLQRLAAVRRSAYAGTPAVCLAANRRPSKHHCFPCFRCESCPFVCKFADTRGVNTLHKGKQIYADGPGQQFSELGVILQQDGQLQEDLVPPR